MLFDEHEEAAVDIGPLAWVLFGLSEMSPPSVAVFVGKCQDVGCFAWLETSFLEKEYVQVVVRKVCNDGVEVVFALSVEAAPSKCVRSRMGVDAFLCEVPDPTTFVFGVGTEP